MSGIAGIICFDGAPVEYGLVEKMTAAMAHRGPHGINHWGNGSVVLGHCMLRTTPESLEENQPLTNEDESLVLVMDGRVDNWEELRRELLSCNVMLRNRSDAELVLKAYETWGRECLYHIDGDFALVIWDARKQIAFCARDRMGDKPFYYHWDGMTFSFASEMHPILSLPWVKQELNEGMLAEFLATEWHSRDETFWLGTLRLEAAHRMEVGWAGSKPEQYWEPNVWMTLPYSKDEDYVDHYRDLFANIVRRKSRSNQPVACEVSGGLDSSAIFAMAVSLRQRHVLPAPSIEGYMLDFHGDPDADELEYGRAVGKHLGCVIQEIQPTRKTLAWYRLRARRYQDFPGYPNGVMGLGIREKARADGSRVLLAGVGGDEWLGGSRAYYAEALTSRKWGELYRNMATDCREVGFGSSVEWLLRSGFFPLLPAPIRACLRKIIFRGKIDGVELDAWLTPAMRRLIQERRAQYLPALPEEIRRPGQRRQISLLADAFSMFARESEERLCSGEGVELRRPFWDARIVEFAFAIPERFRIQGRLNKTLHRQAMKGLLPKRVLMRESKAEFGVTIRQYLPEIKVPLTRDISGRRHDWVRAISVIDLYKQCENPKHSGWPQWMLWTLFGCDAIF